ncbi:MAG: hypothetical protein WCP69_09485 [Bacteroidota bacterium]
MNNNEYKDEYIKQFNKIKNSDDLHYIVITPITNLKSYNQLKFIIRKSIGDYCKKQNINKSHEYIKYLCNIEVDPSISKINQSKISGMGYHAHLIIDKNINLFNSVIIEEFRTQIIETFMKNKIKIDLYDSADIYDENGLMKYHLKQSNILDKTFIRSNLK